MRPKERLSDAVARLRPNHAPAPQCSARDDQFVGMLRAYRLSGGLARGHDLATLLASRSRLDIGTLARWIVSGEVVHFDWQQETWFPMFQFGGPDMAPRAAVSRVLKELHDVFDPWDTAQWFARPSVALANRSPADALGIDPDLVLHAARCDRYVVDA
jgi:hypothetical protein